MIYFILYENILLEGTFISFELTNPKNWDKFQEL